MTAEIQAVIARWSQDLREEFEERAAIMEFCGNMTRQEAEMRAFYLLMARTSNS